MSLYQKVLSGAKWTTIEAFIKALIQILRVYILTKLLSPNDYGIMALVMVVTGFSQIFVDFGISSAIIFKKEITKKELSSLFWFNVFLGIIIFAIVFSLRNVFSHYIFNEPYLAEILKIIAFIFILSGFTTQFTALLRKYLKFQIIAKINIIANFVGFVVTVILAYLGKGVYSLVVGFIVLSIVKSILTISSGLKYHKPQFYFNFSIIKYYLKFGGYQLSERMVSYLRHEGDSLLIGAFLSTEILGMYNVAKVLVTKPIDLIRSIFGKMAFPIFASINNDKLLRKWAVSLNKIVYLAISPVMLMLIVFSETVIYYFYGINWMGAAPFLQLLGILFSVELLRTTFGPLLLSKGKAKLSFNFNLWFTVIVLITLGISLQFSIIHALVGLILVEITIIQVMNFHVIMKPILKFSLKNYIQTIFEVLTPLFFASLITIISYHLLSDKHLIYRNVLLYIGGLSVGILLYYMLNKAIFEILKIKLKEIRYKNISGK
jgi:O-antigen/teichoic acid export membrane protein